MEKRNDGGPAFPVEGYWQNGRIIQGAQTGNETGWHMGLSLRDYFAAKALQGLLGDDVNDSPKRFAVSAYALADAMLAAREK